MKVLKPNKNRLTQGYSDKHKGYDHSGRGDQNYYASFFGKVVQAKNSEDKNWINNGKLTTADYGNYIKIKGQVDGKTIYQLGAHFKQGSVLPVGTEVKRGQVVAQIGNTGNSTGAHSHTEYRDENNQNFSVEFADEIEEPVKEEGMSKRQQIIEAYMGTRPNQPPSEDEISARLQENKGLLYIIQSILEGDTVSREYWLDKWNVDNADTDWKETAESYKQAYNDLKNILKLSEAEDTQVVAGHVRGLVERVATLEKQIKPKIIYKLQNKDYNLGLKIGNIALIIERGD